MSTLSKTTGWFVALLVLGASVGHALDVRRDKGAIFEVPTTGTILDVNYQAEFDEWWVKCREGDMIIIYSYDKRTQRWGHARFVPKKPGDKTAKPTKSEDVRGDRTPDKHDPSGPPPVSGDPPQPQVTKSEGEKSAPADQKSEGSKWWDPFRVFKDEKK